MKQLQETPLRYYTTKSGLITEKSAYRGVLVNSGKVTEETLIARAASKGSSLSKSQVDEAAQKIREALHD